MGKYEAQLEGAGLEDVLRIAADLEADRAHVDAIREEAPEDVPAVEWWDAKIIGAAHLAAAQAPDGTWRLKLKAITNFVEHPVPIEPPGAKQETVAQALKLTRKEVKRLRT